MSGSREAAELVGIPTRRVLALSFGLGVALACGSGMLIATMFPFTVLSGDPYLLKSFVVTVLGGLGTSILTTSRGVMTGATYQLKSFVVTVLGGLGNPAGALLGGIALGLLEGLATPFMPVSWTPVIEFVLFVAVLIAFPGGVLGVLGLRGTRAH